MGDDNSSSSDHGQLLLEAVQDGSDVSRVRELLLSSMDDDDDGFSIANVKDKYYGWTPLHVASRKGYHEIAMLLIEHGAQVNSTSNYQKTPLHWACLEGHSEIANLLIENGADLNAQSKDGKTPLHWACSNNHLETAKLLIDDTTNNATANLLNANVQDVDGLSPLHWACKDGNVDAVRLLLQSNGGGKSVTNETARGSTPLYLASEGNHPEVVWFLVRHYPWLVLENL